MLKVITGQNNIAAYLIPQNQCRVNSTMHYSVITVNPFLHGVCMLRECIYGECTHKQHVRRTLTIILTQP